MKELKIDWKKSNEKEWETRNGMKPKISEKYTRGQEVIVEVRRTTF